MTTIQDPAVIDDPEGRRRVRVWFGQHAICDYYATPELAERYAQAMARRFAGLRVTNDPLRTVWSDSCSGPGYDLPMPQGIERLPSEQLWSIPPS